MCVMAHRVLKDRITKRGRMPPPRSPALKAAEIQEMFGSALRKFSLSRVKQSGERSRTVKKAKRRPKAQRDQKQSKQHTRKLGLAAEGIAARDYGQRNWEAGGIPTDRAVKVRSEQYNGPCHLVPVTQVSSGGPETFNCPNGPETALKEDAPGVPLPFESMAAAAVYMDCKLKDLQSAYELKEEVSKDNQRWYMIIGAKPSNSRLMVDASDSTYVCVQRTKMRQDCADCDPHIH